MSIIQGLGCVLADRVNMIVLEQLQHCEEFLRLSYSRHSFGSQIHNQFIQTIVGEALDTGELARNCDLGLGAYGGTLSSGGLTKKPGKPGGQRLYLRFPILQRHH